jgi:twinkle protein
MIIEPVDILPKVKELRNAATGRKGLSTGIPAVDELMLLSKQYLWVHTGAPSSGKSEVLDMVAICTAILHGWHWLYFSPENYPLEEHMKKLVEKLAGKMLHKMSDIEVKTAADWLQEYFAWINPPEDKLNLDGIMEITEVRMQSGYPVDVLVIDPWNELIHEQGGLRDDQYISKCLTKLRRFHRKYDLLSCVVIHPKAPNKDANGNYPVPTLYDCNGGAMWRNKADFGTCVHRPDFTQHKIDFIVQKIKFKSMGQVGKVPLDYDVVTGRFKDQYSTDFSLPENPNNLPY